MPTKPTIRKRQFRRSFVRMARLRTDRPHTWKSHFRGAVAEVIGYLEMLSKKDPCGEFFVWAEVEDIIRHCTRYKGKAYSRAAIKLSLEYLRKLVIISGIVHRPRLSIRGEMQLFAGRIVAPHYALCTPFARGNYCEFVGFSENPDKMIRGHKWISVRVTSNVGRKKSGVITYYAGKSG